MTNDSGLQPVEFFVVVRLNAVEQKTAGGIIIPDSIQEKDKLSTQEGTLVAVSPHAFSYADDWPAGSKPQVGQRVLFKRYDGALHSRNGAYYRILTDKSIIAIAEPTKVDDSGYSNAPSGAWIRCMGGKFCDHAPATCTASPEYQAAIRKQLVEERAA